MRRRAYQRLIAKIASDQGVEAIKETIGGEQIRPFDIYVAMLDRGDPKVLQTKFLYKLFRFHENETRPALSVAWWRYELMVTHGGTAEGLMRYWQQHPERKPDTHLTKAVTTKFLATAVDRLVKASPAMLDRDLLPAELAELREISHFDPDDPDGPQYPENPENLLTLYIGPDEHWHCANCFEMDEDSASALAALYPDWGFNWMWSMSLPEHEVVANLLGFDSNFSDGPLYSIMDTLTPPDLLDNWEGMAPAYLALLSDPEQQDQHLKPIWQQWKPILGRRLMFALDSASKQVDHVAMDQTLLPLEKAQRVYTIFAPLVNPLNHAVGRPDNPKFPPHQQLEDELDALGITEDWPG